MEEAIKVKKCTKCGKIKPVTEFNKRKASKDGYTYRCKECEAAQARAYYKKKKRRQKMKEYYEKHKEEHRQRVAQNYRENRERYLEYHREYIKENPEVRQACEARRRERLKKQKGIPYTREEIIERDSKIIDGKKVPVCGICNQPIWDPKDIHIDHIVPLSQGGLDCRDNVRVVHSLCNLVRPRDGRDVLGS